MRTKISEYARDGKIDLVRKELQYKDTDIDNTSYTSSSKYYGATPLYLAIENGHEDIALLLLEKGANLNIHQISNDNNIRCNLPIYTACEKGYTEIAEALIEHGSVINTPIGVNNITPIMIAVKNNNLDIVKFLIEKNASLDLLDGSGLDVFAFSSTDEMNELLAHYKPEGNIAAVQDGWHKVSDHEMFHVEKREVMAEEIKELFNFEAMNLTVTIRNLQTNAESSFRHHFSKPEVNNDDVYKAMLEFTNAGVSIIERDVVSALNGIRVTRVRNLKHKKSQHS